MYRHSTRKYVITQQQIIEQCTLLRKVTCTVLPGIMQKFVALVLMDKECCR